MKLPQQISRITLRVDDEWTGLFPPLGFIGFEEGNNGAGDYYGLYWSLGKEDHEPIICQFRHEEYLLEPEYSNLSSFLAHYTNQNLDEIYLDGRGLNNATFFLMPFQKARVLAKKGKVKDAIEKLQLSINLFGEYSDSWGLLSEQLRAEGDLRSAEKAARNAILSSWAFGLPSQKAIASFEAIREQGPLAMDPLVQRKAGLLSGNTTYDHPFWVDPNKLHDCIKAYWSQQDFRNALLLEQNYGYWMNGQSSDIQSKFEFEPTQWKDAFLQRCLAHYPKRLTRIT